MAALEGHYCARSMRILPSLLNISHIIDDSRPSSQYDCNEESENKSERNPIDSLIDMMSKTLEVPDNFNVWIAFEQEITSVHLEWESIHFYKAPSQHNRWPTRSIIPSILIARLILKCSSFLLKFLFPGTNEQNKMLRKTNRNEDQTSPSKEDLEGIRPTFFWNVEVIRNCHFSSCKSEEEEDGWRKYVSGGTGMGKYEMVNDKTFAHYYRNINDYPRISIPIFSCMNFISNFRFRILRIALV